MPPYAFPHKSFRAVRVDRMPLNIAIVASGSGSNAQAIFEKIESGLIDAKVSLVISNRPGAKVLERAQKFSIPTLELDHKAFPDRESFDARLVQALQECGAQLIVLAGYMRILTPIFLQAFENKVINVHPALLPSFVGAHGAADALSYGVKMSGCTVHFVNEEVDGGAIIAQAAVPVLPQDTSDSLQKRIQAMEHRLFPQVIQWIAAGRVSCHERQVHVQASSQPKAAMAQNMTGDEAFFIWPPLESGF